MAAAQFCEHRGASPSAVCGVCARYTAPASMHVPIVLDNASLELLDATIQPTAQLPRTALTTASATVSCHLPSTMTAFRCA